MMALLKSKWQGPLEESEEGIPINFRASSDKMDQRRQAVGIFLLAR